MIPNDRESLRATLLVALRSLALASLVITGVSDAQNPVPLINQPLLPDAVKPGSPGFTLTVNGTDFVSGSTVHWNGNPLPTSFVNRSRLKANVPATYVAKTGTASVTVVNPGSGATSSTAFLQVFTPTPAILFAVSGFGVGVNPAGVAVGDFNGDGKLDLASANYGMSSNNVSILIGNGDGTFQPVVNYSVPNGALPAAVAVGDFNGDGKLDLAVAHGGDEYVSVLLGNGDGTFQPALNYGVGAGGVSYSVAVGDFNGDGKLDLVVANNSGGGFGSDCVSVLLGNGDGTFRTAANYNAGSWPFSVAVGDFNRDGKLDLVVANDASNNLSVLLGNGDGTFQAAVNYNVGSQPTSVMVGDFNADGKLDLVATNLGSNTVSVLLGNGDGTFKPAVDYNSGSNPRWTGIADVNGDGKPDLVVANNAVNGGTSSVSVLLGIGNGTFQTAVNYSAGVEPEAIAVGDFDGDGRLDIAVADLADSSSTVFVLLSGTVSFGDQIVGANSAAQPVTLTNYGGNTLSITNVGISGTDTSQFTQTNTCGNSLGGGASCSIDVTFAPTKIGPRKALLSVFDSAAGSPQIARLTGAGTIASFSPPTLDFGRVSIASSATLTTTLTNTGNVVIKLSSISATGAGYSETNSCGSTVQPGGTCTITVTFAPPTLGLLVGTVWAYDNGGGSPQQVPLSGTGYSLSHATELQSALASQNTATVPSPSGKSPVGTRVLDLVDPTRDDPFQSNGSKRELLLRFWYPKSIESSCQAAEYASPQVWSYFSALLGIALPSIHTNSCLDAPLASGTHPIVVFTHGYTGTFTDYTFLFEDLASRGYVVASVDHTYEATAEEFPDGRFVTSLVGSHFAEGTLRFDNRTLTKAVSVRLQDIKSVLDELTRLNVENDSPFAAKLDMKHIAIAGHSLGGVTALLSVEKNARIRAAVSIDGWPESLNAVTKTPVLLMAAGHRQWSDAEQRLWDQLAGPRVAVNLRGAEHVTPTDAIWLANGAIKTGTMGSEKTIAAIRDYIAAFLDQNLLGRPANLRLTGPAAEYPDAELTTQKQALHSK